jgi:PAS domain S-box-containing protein
MPGQPALALATAAGKVGLWDWNLVANTVKWNDAVYAIHGVDRATFKVTLESFKQLIHPEDLDKVEAAIRQTLEADVPYELEFRVIRGDGSAGWVFTNGTVVRQDGRPVRMIGATLDITSAHHTADAQRRLAAIVESSDDAILSKDLNSIIQTWNAGAERLFGYTESEVVGRPVTILIPADRQDEEPGILARIRRGERIAHYETVRRRKDGTLLNVSLTVSPLRDAGGRIVGASKIARDITGQKQAEKALRESEERFRLLASHAPVGIFLSDPAGQCVFVNAPWSAMSGLDVGAAQGEGWTRAVHPDDRERVIAGWREAIVNGTGSVTEFRFLHPDGQVTWVQGNAVQFDGGAGFRGYMGSVIDVTQRKEAELRSAFLHDLSDQVARMGDPEEIVQVTQRSLGEHLRADRCYFFEILGDQNVAIVGVDWRREGLPPTEGRHRLEDFGSREFLDLLAQPRLAISDLAVHPVTRPQLANYSALQMRGLATSTHSTEHRHLLSLAVATCAPREWTAPELDLIENVTARIWPAIERARAQRSARLRMVALERLNETGTKLVAEHDLEKIVQLVTDVGREVSGAAFGAFFYNVVNAQGESYTLYTLSGAPRSAFEKFPMPRATEMFGPTFRGEGVIRVDDVHADPRYGKSPPHHGMPPGHLPVRSYLAVPVTSRAGDVLGGLFFGHPEVGVFKRETETVLVALAAQTAIAMDNAKLYAALQRELAEQRRTEAMLRDSETRWRQLAQAMPHLVWTCAADGACEYLSPQWVAYTGRTEAEQLGEGWLSSVHPDDVPDLRKKWTVAIAAGGTFAAEFRIRRADGQYRAFQTRAVPVRDTAGRIVKWYGTNTDIEDLRRIEQAIRKSEHQLRLVTDHAPVFLAQCDVNHRFKFANRPYAERYGLTREDIIGRHVSEITGADAYETFRGHMDNTLAGRRVEFEQEIPYATLGRRWVHVIYEPERGPNGTIVGLVAVIVDITTRKQAELELARARDEALAASRAKDDFLAALSHELRTPLSPVLLVASDAANNPALPRDIRDSFEMIRTNVSLEARLIDDLLDLTRIARGKMPLELQRLDVHEVLRDALANIRAEIEAKRMDLDLHLDAARSHVMGDPVRLQQVIWNLLKNAVKFTPEGGQVRLVTESASDPDRITIEVADNGMGMTPAELARVFEAFTQGEHAAGGGSHRYGGLGLGLAISQKLVEMHSGRIYATSAGRNRGSIFVVELPLAAPAAAPDAARPELPGPASPSPAPTGGTILLVEDHASTRETLQKLLSRRNFQVITAASTAEARALAAVRSFDFLVSDVGLPDGDGYQLMRDLQSAHPGLEGIAISGYGMEDDLKRSRHAGFAIHLVKPVAIEALESALARLASR